MQNLVGKYQVYALLPEDARRAVAYLRLLREVAPAWKQPEKVPKNKLQKWLL